MIFRKNYIWYLIIFFICVGYVKSLCIQGENCPINQGFCSEGQCICLYGIVTFSKFENPNNITYCNYHQVNRIAPLVIEIFFPSIGLFFIGRLIHGFIKLSLIIIILLYGKKVLPFNLIVALAGYIFIILHVVDLICLAFAFYRDGNGIRLL